jgi:uncharacterized OB-fold protein
VTITSADADVLSASRCPACGEIAVPAAHRCPACLRGVPCERLALSGAGRLRQFTVLHTPTGRFEAPYVVGFVDVPEGATLYCRLQAPGGGRPEPAIGDAVRLEARDGELHCVVEGPA